MNSTSTNDTKAVYAGYLSAGLLLALALFYILRVDIYTLGGDQMRWVDLIDKMFRGELHLSDLWSSHGSHRAPAYKAIFLLNARYLDLNQQWEQVLGALSWAIAAGIAVFGSYRHFGHERSATAALLVLVTVPLLVINGQIMPTVLGYSVISLRMLDMACFFLIFFLLSRSLLQPPSLRTSAVLAFLLVSCSLFIGRGWGQGMLLTVLFVLGAFIVANRSAVTRDRIIRTVLPTALTAIACVVIYQASMEYDERRGVAGLSHILDIPALLSFASMLLGRTLTFQHIDVHNGDNRFVVQAIGVVVIGLYLFATVLFFKEKQWRRGWFPFALMVFSAAAVLLVYLGRGAVTGDGESWRGALFPRHLPECSVGLVGALVIIATHARAGRALERAVVALCLILVVSQSAAVARSMYQTRFVINHNTQKAAAFFGPVAGFASPAIVKRAGCHTEQLCIYVRSVLDGHGLMERARLKAAEVEAAQVRPVGVPRDRR